MTASHVNLLLVDNEPDNLEPLQKFLAGLGVNLILATSGQQALRNIEIMDFAAVVLDLHIPGLSGFELARRISNGERSKSTPIIFVTGADPRAFPIEQAYAFGADDYLVSRSTPSSCAPRWPCSSSFIGTWSASTKRSSASTF